MAESSGTCTTFIELAREHVPDLLTTAQWLTGGPGEAAELTRASLREGSRSYGEFNGDLTLRTWLLRTMCDLCEAVAEAEPEPALAGFGECSPGYQPVLSAESLAVAVWALPDWVRRPLVLRDIAGLPYGDIAAALRIPVGAVRSRIYRGREALLKHVDADRVTEPRSTCGVAADQVRRWANNTEEDSRGGNDSRTRGR